MRLRSDGIAGMIKIVKEDITNKESLKANGINAIVNAAKPTLMGSNQGVDGAIHKTINDKLPGNKQFKDYICDELKTEKKENIIRCQRGKAVITSGNSLCQYVIHAVGTKYDVEPGKSGEPSSSRVQMLENCYYEIIKIIKDKDIKNIAIPIIGSGEYRFPFELAAQIAIASIGNALVEWYNEDPEMFEMSDLECIYFYIYDHDSEENKKNYMSAIKIFKKYEPILKNNKKVTFQTSFEGHKRYIEEIKKYDSQKGYFFVARAMRLLTMCFRYVYFPEMMLKDKIGGCNWEKRRGFVEGFAFIKMVFPILLMFILSNTEINGSNIIKVNIVHQTITIDNSNIIMNVVPYIIDIMIIIIVYAMVDTITYLLTLILMADIQRPSANIIRSMIMLLVNFVEVSMDMACLCFFKYHDIISTLEAVMFGLLGEWPNKIVLKGMTDYIFLYADAGIKFFFASLVFGYFSNHMIERKFKR